MKGLDLIIRETLRVVGGFAGTVEKTRDVMRTG